MPKRQRDLTESLSIARSMLDQGLITTSAFREIEAATKKYDLQRRTFGRYIVGQTR
jgi:hypothetical protein